MVILTILVISFLIQRCTLFQRKIKYFFVYVNYVKKTIQNLNYFMDNSLPHFII